MISVTVEAVAVRGNQGSARQPFVKPLGNKTGCAELLAQGHACDDFRRILYPVRTGPEVSTTFPRSSRDHAGGRFLRSFVRDSGDIDDPIQTFAMLAAPRRWTSRYCQAYDWTYFVIGSPVFISCTIQGVCASVLRKQPAKLTSAYTLQCRPINGCRPNCGDD